MGESVQLIIGAETICSDGCLGEIIGALFDLRTQVVSHIAVEPRHRKGLGRLVPLELVDVSNIGVLLRCTSTEFETLDHAEETLLIPGTGGRAGYVAGRPLADPSRGLVDVIGVVPQPLTYDTVPRGEIELRRAEKIDVTNGKSGTIRGLVIDQETRRVTHLLLHDHHVWSHKAVTVPVEEVVAAPHGLLVKRAERGTQGGQTLSPHMHHWTTMRQPNNVTDGDAPGHSR
jgi:sporulation protein YlmC with PRC-barrel domain